MNFQKTFLDALITSSSIKESIFERLPKIPSVPTKIKESLSYVQAYDAVSVSYPYYYEISKLNSFCLIYTEKGLGLLTVNNRNYTMKKETIAFINCNQWYRIEIKKSPWSYKFFFISGLPVNFFYNSFVEDSKNVHTLLPGTSVPDKIELLYDFLLNSSDKPLIHAKYISDILFQLLIEKNRLHEMNTCINDCIYEIKHDFDFQYMNNISLEFLEHKYHISKYHICREFTKRFHMSPIQYLNYRKIEVAKEILIHTDKTINEVGRMIGFENPNNFIRNFKKRTGVTPLQYRKQFLTG